MKCPWCGDDPSHHLGIHLESGHYHCWRSQSHSGSSPRELIAALVGCTLTEARAIYGAGSQPYGRSDDSFAGESLRRLGFVLDKRPASPGPLRPLPEFVPVRDAGICRTLVYPYLITRGYTRRDVGWLTERFGLMYAHSGPFTYRVIIPVVAEGRLVNWTGRSIAASEELRYKSLSTDPDKAAKQGLPPALVNVKETLLDFDELRRGGEVLVVTEGPFDAMRVALLGERQGVRATCLFGKEVVPAQVDLLAQLSDKYDRVVAMFDRGTAFDVFLHVPDYLHIGEVELPYGVKDPAELSQRQFDSLLEGI